MYKATQKASEIITKTGSHSTRASPTGKNLLGWDEKVQEHMSLAQERESLIAALESKERVYKTLPNPSIDRKQARFELDRIIDRLAVIRKMLRITHDDVGEFVIQIFRERVTPAEWKIIIAEARLRAEVNAMMQGKSA